ncbi:ER oligosaccharyltransferase complex subunit beta [Komagataella phaffii CBS 7435]|uniref:Dolichyl-diphosphooligosaccharide--protein glycosyltransferase subunit WBP1 n=2 Tax=Komagataella phaffii TaxID=460519 RepID=C4R0M2_KOMPG|nr:Beta subunit of the oligosaccharyl transferase (OST) glycoprotein complex [Komagataella phaffii GS115]AOA62515.1 GQ67_00464T0 [Komagataella phaffii]CAH2448436.1 ER oligosaccharyltransferase complex subunit beta [Komagataella phaffii CBS 7435]AOA67290.1 GQ68_00925T0 [Komagataella phaffii GS115]CAY69046.1 Beta subunit of the oligosaccharyl transferase (OST) glycoprotein complex [Komagataella phaffii GS115]CCA38558.1 ER oligosaccharyltransferase complex subunit beta [Komagataella phaffii CBS 7
MNHFKGLIVLIWSFCTAVMALSPIASDTLVVYDSSVLEFGEFSSLVDHLNGEFSRVDIVDLNDKASEVQLFYNQKRIYQNLFVFPISGQSNQGDLNALKLIEFVNEGGDIISITNQVGSNSEIVAFNTELGIYPSPKNYKLIDHFNGVNEQHDEIRLSLEESVVPNSIVAFNKAIVYSGAASLLSNNEYLIPLLKAPKTSFAYDINEGVVNEQSTWTSGDQGFLAVAFQGLNNARSLWLGSTLFFDNEHFDQSAKDLVDWTFQSRNLLKSTFAKHYLTDAPESTEEYKVKDEVSYEIGLSEWNGKEWVPFKANDVQLELIMLDPYYRITLEQVKTEDESVQVYTSGPFKLPDQHGMFTFSTKYFRPGYTFIEEEDIVPVRHLANDEYPRSWEITNSWVYVASAGAVVIAWIIFVIFFLYSTEDATEIKKNI